MDFYTSPISIEVDGVDIRVKIVTAEESSSKDKAGDDSIPVPNAVDLAQSFLESEPKAERQRLEQALEAETQDLGASFAASEDGSEEEQPAFGTGQPLSLPFFLADFLQGLLDRMQVSINAVSFQLEMDIPQDSSNGEAKPVSFQIALDDVSIEGVTTQPAPDAQPSTIEHKEGKRLVSLSSVRAYLISEANVFPLMSQSPSMASPSISSSPALTRNPVSRQGSSLSDLVPPDDLVASFQPTLQHQVSDSSSSGSENATSGLGISSHDAPFDDNVDDIPSTPKASIYHDFGDESITDAFVETQGSLSESQTSNSRRTPTNSTLLRELPFKSAESSITQDQFSSSPNAEANSPSDIVEDLAESHLYTREEAESMYMSAFSQRDASFSRQWPQDISKSTATPHSEPLQASETINPPRSVMPGAWDDEASVELPKATDSTVADTSEPVTPTIEGPNQHEISEQSDDKEEQHMEPDAQPELEPRDEVPTPRGPTRVVKEILHFEKLSLYLPSLRSQSPLPLNESIHQNPAAMADSVYPQAPGAFSVHAGLSSQYMTAPKSGKDVRGDIEVHVSPIEINFDASLAFLLASAVAQLTKALKPQDTALSSKPAEQGKNDLTVAPIKLIIDEIAFNFLSRLPGRVATTGHKQERIASFFDRDVLLNVTLGQLTASRCPVESPASNAKRGTAFDSILTKIDLQKFRFGYANGDIISFDSGRPMSTSVRDTFLSTGYDVGIKIIQTKTGTRTEIETLPLVLQIELQRLDETFSWFGGLSSFLNMSTSMAAISSPVSKAASPVPAKPRGVRFDTPIDPTDKSAANANKLNVRIGGGYVELLGKECSVSAESNAIKLVSREEGIGVACSLVRVSGPYIRNSMAEAAISTDITGIRADFLTTPKSSDLEKLLELIIPSKVKYDHTTDEIMVDTLLRQRRKGSVLRINIDKIAIRVANIAQLSVLPNLGEELAKLSTVAKYLPEDDRPGLLTLAKVQRITAGVQFDNRIGSLDTELTDLEVGHITMPSLVAILAQNVALTRNKTEELVRSSPFRSDTDIAKRPPAFMARMIGDEIEPVIKLKLHELLVEYRVQTIMDIIGLGDDATPQDFEDGLAASVANLGDQTQTALSRNPPSPSQSSKHVKPIKVDVGFQDCMIGLNPLHLESKMIIVLADSQLGVTLPKDGEMETTLNINKASILLVDNFAEAMDGTSVTSTPRTSAATSPQVIGLCNRGFVDICYISSAMVVVRVAPGPDGQQQVDVSLHDDLLVLETCADSTQTLITLANALKPPTPSSQENKYRTNVVPVQDLLASISAEAFGRSEGEYDFDQDFAGAQEMAGSGSDLGLGSDGSLRVDSQFYGDEDGEELFDATKSPSLSRDPTMEDTAEGVLLTGFDASQSQTSVSSDDLVIHENFFGQRPSRDGTAKLWNSNRNTYDSAPDKLVKHSPVRVAVRDVHVIWNLFDGYDWVRTRDVIGKAVQDVENRAIERQARLTGQHLLEEDDEDETVGDFLFNSIYIEIPANRDPHELSRAINTELNDNATETESIATTAFTNTTSRTARRHQPRPRRLKLHRSKHHKITFELQGVNADLTVFPPDSGETLSSVDVRVQNLDIFDHVPTSTWKKFATYDQDQGEREMGTNMVHLELLTVKPLPHLGASETVLRATLLPLRLHVDQDALDFITRFFEFKDDKVPVHASPSDIPFVQRAEINSIPVKLDFKPKRVDYAGLRSGHTTEFMNFIVLEESRMVLRHVIIYGISGFDRLGKTLNDIWMPDVRNNQLPGVIAGLAPVRSIVNIGSGFKDLVEIPIREYQKDGRVFRSISKGAAAFARNTGTELVKLGAKLAVGTQYALQGAEEMLTDKPHGENTWDDDDLDEEDKKQISLYADQPTGVIQGIRGGYRSLVRDMNMAKDAIIAVPGEVMESQSAAGAAKVVLKRAPTIMFRPAVGVSRAVGKAFMGATNSIDPHNRRRIGEVSSILLLLETR